MQKVKDYMKNIYGMDALSCGMILLSLAINLVTALLFKLGLNRIKMWNMLCFVPLFICLFRCFSINRTRRSRENQWFIRRLDPLFQKKERTAQYGEGEQYRIHSESQKENRRAFKFFKCPACRQKIRVPKGKGKIEITCPRCSDKFIKKT